MVNSRSKGMRGEYYVRDMLRTLTGLRFERVPQSGALEYLKGDIYLPDASNTYCIEVKNVGETPFSDKLFTQEKTNPLINWWKKLLVQKGDKKPVLFFKYNRSPVFAVIDEEPKAVEKWVYIQWLNAYVVLAEEWIKNEDIKWKS